jgi:hypothetical protein
MEPRDHVPQAGELRPFGSGGALTPLSTGPVPSVPVPHTSPAPPKAKVTSERLIADRIAAAAATPHTGPRLVYGNSPEERGGHRKGPPPAPRELPGLPADCPVLALGHANGTFFYLAPSGQVRGVADAKLNASGIRGLFENRIEWLHEWFPSYTREGERAGWKAAEAQEWLIAQASDSGLFDPERDLRGEGVWRADDEVSLIMHCGDKLLIDGRYVPPGRYGRYVYPTRRAQPRPSDESLTWQEGQQLLELLGTWQWVRPDIDPKLMLGWIGCATLNAALQWRPHIWLGGDRATGKSALQDLLKALLGSALESYSNTSAAGIRAALQRASRPVALDEMEAKEANEKADDVVELARIASTRNGGKGVRSNPDGTARFFEIETVFMFSSILIPPLAPQDQQRITVLDLRPLNASPGQATSVRKRIADAAALGGKLRRRVLNGWARWSETLDLYQAALAKAGHPTRSTDQHGALLAMYDILTGDELPDADTIEETISHIDANALKERVDDMSDHERCLVHLLSADMDVWRSGEKRVVGDEIQNALNDTDIGHAEAERRLRLIGLGTMWLEGKRYLAVSNVHQGVGKLFAGTHWSAKANRTGAWRQALMRIEGTRPAPYSIRFAGLLSRATLIPTKALDFDQRPAPPDGQR